MCNGRADYLAIAGCAPGWGRNWIGWWVSRWSVRTTEARLLPFLIVATARMGRGTDWPADKWGYGQSKRGNRVTPWPVPPQPPASLCPFPAKTVNDVRPNI